MGALIEHTWILCDYSFLCATYQKKDVIVFCCLILFIPQYCLGNYITSIYLYKKIELIARVKCIFLSVILAVPLLKDIQEIAVSRRDVQEYTFLIQIVK